MDEMEACLSGAWYDCHNQVFLDLKTRARHLLSRYHELAYEQREERRAVLEELVDHGDWVKTLAVYPRRERPNPPVDAWMLPEGGVHVDEGTLDVAASDRADELDRELLW